LLNLDVKYIKRYRINDINNPYVAMERNVILTAFKLRPRESNNKVLGRLFQSKGENVTGGENCVMSMFVPY
jgi:hypothetical protein